MPTVTNDVLTKSPKGQLLADKETAIPDGVDFVFAPAADGIKGGYTNDLGSYVFEKWPAVVDNAYQKGVLAAALFTLRVNGNDYPMDFVHPENDRQLQGFLYAVKNKTYAMWGMMVVTDDSPAKTVEAITHFGNNLRKFTGKRGFLMVTLSMWEGKRWNGAWSEEQHAEFAKLIQSEIGNAEYSKWSLLIVGQYNVPENKGVQTPGNFGITRNRNVIWENQPKKLIMWMDKAFNAQFLGVEWPTQGTQPPAEEEIPPEGGNDDGDEDIPDEGDGGEADTGDNVIVDMSEVSEKLDMLIELVAKLVANQEMIYRV